MTKPLSCCPKLPERAFPKRGRCGVGQKACSSEEQEGKERKVQGKVRIRCCCCWFGDPSHELAPIFLPNSVVLYRACRRPYRCWVKRVRCI